MRWLLISCWQHNRRCWIPLRRGDEVPLPDLPPKFQQHGVGSVGVLDKEIIGIASYIRWASWAGGPQVQPQVAVGKACGQEISNRKAQAGANKILPILIGVHRRITPRTIEASAENDSPLGKQKWSKSPRSAAFLPHQIDGAVAAAGGGRFNIILPGAGGWGFARKPEFAGAGKEIAGIFKAAGFPQTPSHMPLHREPRPSVLGNHPAANGKIQILRKLPNADKKLPPPRRCC